LACGQLGTAGARWQTHGMGKLHKVFISYHHALDESYKRIFELRFGNAFGAIISAAVDTGDIDTSLPTETIRQKIRDEHLRDASVTVVLIGEMTWQRKHVDWEISSTLRDSKLNPRGGLLGIVLPAYHKAYYQGKTAHYNPYTIPPRLYDNIKSKYATLHNWNEDADLVAQWIHDAYLRKSNMIPDNSRELFSRNRTADDWR